MVFMGLHTAKEVEKIKLEHKSLGYKEAEEKYEKIILNHSQNNQMLANDIKDMNSHLLKLSSELKEKDKKVKVLRFFLAVEADKEVKRLEAIAKRTRKPRIKKKCESRIIDYKMRKLAYEKGTDAE